MLTISDLFHLDDTIAASLFAGKTYPWEVLEGLSAYILQLGATLSPEEFDRPAEDVWICLLYTSVLRSDVGCGVSTYVV